MSEPEAPAPLVERPGRSGGAAIVFVVIGAVALASLGPAALILAGVGRVTTPAGTPAPAPVATTAAARTPTSTAAAGTVRVSSTRGSSRPIANGRQHEVTFVWVLEGAREGDAVSVQFYAGNRALGQTSGPLDPSVFSFSTGTFTLAATLDCSTAGWSADLLTVRGQAVVGDGEATVPPVTCP